jgi:hypothetical protein
MTGVDVIKSALGMSQQLTLQVINDMRDAPLTYPTPNGGNHPLWVLGHLAYAEGSLVQKIMQGRDNPVDEWAEHFGPGSEPHEDASRYPGMDEVMAKYEQLRGQTMSLLNELSDEDLDRTSAACPEGREAFFGTWGGCLSAVALHTMNHRGQVCDSRRALQRERLLG